MIDVVMSRMILKGRGPKRSTRGEFASHQATAEEVEQLTETLVALVARQKHQKASEHLVAWFNEAGMSGAGLLTVFTSLRVAEACIRLGAPVEQLEQRVPQVPGVQVLAAAGAALSAQSLVADIIARAAAGEQERPTEDELVAVWQDPKKGALVVYYYLQCLAQAAALDSLGFEVLTAPGDPGADTVADAVPDAAAEDLHPGS
jgi:hypothetical protein